MIPAETGSSRMSELERHKPAVPLLGDVMYAIPQSRFNRPLPPVRRRRKDRGGSGKGLKVRFYKNDLTKIIENLGAP